MVRGPDYRCDSPPYWGGTGGCHLGLAVGTLRWSVVREVEPGTLDSFRELCDRRCDVFQRSIDISSLDRKSVRERRLGAVSLSMKCRFARGSLGRV